MNIFITKNGDRQGPYSINDVKNLIVQGTISMSDQAWHEGCVGWARIIDMPLLVDGIIPELPAEIHQADKVTPTLATPQPLQETDATASLKKQSESGTNWLRLIVAAMILVTLLIVTPFWIFLIALVAAIWMGISGKFNNSTRKSA